MKNFDYKKYLLVFVMTCGIFYLAFLIAGRFDQRQVSELRNLENKISQNILSAEIEFELWRESNCASLHTSPLAPELRQLAEKLSYLEENFGKNDANLNDLKKTYSILQAKDMLLTKRASERCVEKPFALIYFYSNLGDCKDCEKQGREITKLTENYPNLRTYVFDTNLDLKIIGTLKRIYKIDQNLPAIVLGEKTLSGFHDLESLEKSLPAVVKNLNENKKSIEGKTI